MKKLLFFSVLFLFVANIFAQTMEQGPATPITGGHSLKSTNAAWTVQYSSSIASQIWGPGSYGIESDGTHLFITKWQSNKFYKLTTAGALVDSFAVTGTLTGGIRDLAYDGTYFYGSNNSNTIYKMDFVAKTIVSTIVLPTGFAVRHIAYDPAANSGAGGLWCGPWNVQGPRLYSMTGTYLDSIPAANIGTYSGSGSAFDNVSPGGPYLWLYSQATGGSGNDLIQMNVVTKQKGLTHDIAQEIPAIAGVIGGGLFQKTNLISGTTTLGGLVQGSYIWGVNLASTIPPAVGIEMKTLTLQAYVQSNTAQTLAGTLRNSGTTPITSFNLNYSVNNGASVTQNITAANIASFATYNYSHTSNWTPAAVGSYTVKIWASNINGNASLNSDTITRIVNAVAVLTNRKVVLEEYTGIYCQYCPDGHKKANEYKALHPNDVYIINIHQGSYANQTGSDPNFKTAFGDALANQTGLTGYPAGTINRHVFAPATTTSLSRSLWIAKGDEVLTMPTYATMLVSATVNYTSRLLTVNSTVNYTANGPALNMLNIALLQNNVEGPQTGGATYNPTQMLPNGKYNHGHMLRHLLTGQWGDSINVTTSGTVRTKTYTYTLPANINGVNLDMYNIEVVGFLTEGKQEIVTGAEFKLPLSISEIGNKVDFNIYPNPANDNVQLSLNLNEMNDVSIMIYNSLGALVFNQNQGKMAGSQTISFDVSAFTKGIYYINVKAGDNTSAKKLVIE